MGTKPTIPKEETVGGIGRFLPSLRPGSPQRNCKPQETSLRRGKGPSLLEFFLPFLLSILSLLCQGFCKLLWMGPAEKVLFCLLPSDFLEDQSPWGKRTVDSEGVWKSGFFQNNCVTLTHWAQGLKSISFMTVCSNSTATALLKDHSQENEYLLLFCNGDLIH